MRTYMKKLINDYEKIKHPDIFLVANATIMTEKMSFYNIEHAISDEFFSLDEFQQITSALFKSGSYVNIFYNEISFIEYILKNFNNLKLDDIIVYNLARDGIKEGKKSLIPSFCDLIGIKYTGSNAFVTSLCRNKYCWSTILEKHNIKVPNSILYKKGEYIGDVENLQNRKVIIKNNRESASIGLSEESITIYSKINHYLEDRDECLIQEYIDGLECEVPFFNFNNQLLILDPVAIKCKNNNSIITSNISNNYDYTFDFLNTQIDELTCKKIQKTVKKIVKILNIQSYGRVDFRIDSDNSFYAIDIAATPYTIKHSSFAFLFNRYNLNYEDIFKMILYASLKKY